MLHAQTVNIQYDRYYSNFLKIRVDYTRAEALEIPDRISPRQLHLCWHSSASSLGSQNLEVHEKVVEQRLEPWK